MAKYRLTWQGRISGYSYVEGNNAEDAIENAHQGEDDNFQEIDTYDMVVMGAELLKD